MGVPQGSYGRIDRIIFAWILKKKWTTSCVALCYVVASFAALKTFNHRKYIHPFSPFSPWQIRLCRCPATALCVNQRKAASDAQDSFISVWGLRGRKWPAQNPFGKRLPGPTESLMSTWWVLFLPEIFYIAPKDTKRNEKYLRTPEKSKEGLLRNHPA